MTVYDCYVSRFDAVYAATRVVTAHVPIDAPAAKEYESRSSSGRQRPVLEGMRTASDSAEQPMSRWPLGVAGAIASASLHFLAVSTLLFGGASHWSRGPDRTGAGASAIVPFSEPVMTLILNYPG